ncbi:hypothetical protein SIK96_17040, partial [Clostridioides difficile]|nr:hypothetical protein [Clostridioides difficile]
YTTLGVSLAIIILCIIAFSLKKRDLYDCDNQPKTPEEAVLYTRKRNFNIFKKTIPLYDKEGIKIIGRFEIN